VALYFTKTNILL